MGVAPNLMKDQMAIRIEGKSHTPLSLATNTDQRQLAKIVTIDDGVILVGSAMVMKILQGFHRRSEINC